MNFSSSLTNCFRRLSYVIALLLCCTLIFAQEEVAEKTAAGLYNDGLALLKEKNYAEGLNMMEEALELAMNEENTQVIDLAKANGSVASYNLGKIAFKEKNLDEALQRFSRGIELNEQSTSNYLGKAQVLQEKEMYSEAMDTYFMAADLAEANNKAKTARIAQKRAKQIVLLMYKNKDYASVTTLGNNYLERIADASISYYVGKSLIEQESYADALAHLDTAIENSEEDKDKIIYAKAQALESMGKKDEAIEAYKLITDAKYKEHADYKIRTLE